MMQRHEIEMLDNLVAAPWSLPADEVTAQLGVDPAVGLDSTEARRRLERFGRIRLGAWASRPQAF